MGRKGSNPAGKFDDRSKQAANKTLALMQSQYDKLGAADNPFQRKIDQAKFSQDLETKQAEDTMEMQKEQGALGFTQFREQSLDNFQLSQQQASLEAEQSRQDVAGSAMTSMVQAGKSGFAGGSMDTMRSNVARSMGGKMKGIGLNIKGAEMDLTQGIQNQQLNAIQSADAAALSFSQTQEGGQIAFENTQSDLLAEQETAMDSLGLQMQQLIATTAGSFQNPHSEYNEASGSDGKSHGYGIDIGNIIRDSGGE